MQNLSRRLHEWQTDLFNAISKVSLCTWPWHPAVSRWSGQNPLCVTEGTRGVSQCASPSSSDNKLALTPFGKHWAFQGHLSPQDLAYLTSEIMGPVTAHCTGGHVLVLHSHSHSQRSFPTIPLLLAVPTVGHKAWDCRMGTGGEVQVMSCFQGRGLVCALWGRKN